MHSIYSSSYFIFSLCCCKHTIIIAAVAATLLPSSILNIHSPFLFNIFDLPFEPFFSLLRISLNAVLCCLSTHVLPFTSSFVVLVVCLFFYTFSMFFFSFFSGLETSFSSSMHFPKIVVYAMFSLSPVAVPLLFFL